MRTRGSGLSPVFAPLVTFLHRAPWADTVVAYLLPRRTLPGFSCSHKRRPVAAGLPPPAASAAAVAENATPAQQRGDSLSHLPCRQLLPDFVCEFAALQVYLPDQEGA